VLGIVLAAGAGVRYGRPKALVDGWLAHAVETLLAGGCAPVMVVLGARAEEARALVPAEARVVVARDWETGMGASLRAGLAAAVGTDVDTALVSLVDLPGLTPAAVARVATVARACGPAGLVQATYGGVPGHPVALGRGHWQGVAGLARGDHGARDYLRGRSLLRVECGDVADGQDVDVPEPAGASDAAPARGAADRDLSGDRAERTAENQGR